MEVTVTSVQSVTHQTTTTTTQQPNRLLRWWIRHHRHIGLASIAGSAVLICVIAVILLPIILHHLFEENQNCSITSTTENARSSTLSTMITANYSLSNTTQIVYIDSLCAANATWKTQGVTVAGSSDGISSNSRAGLENPHDLLVDTSGNLFVADCGNYRVVYWPINATEGRIVAGTGILSSWINAFKSPASIVAWNDQLYVSDLDNYRILAFPLSETEGSSDGITIIGCYGEGSALNQINYVYYMTIDRIRQLFYLSDFRNNRILKLNLIDNSLQLVVGTGLVGPLGITVDETTGSLYVTDSGNHRIQKFNFNSIQGITVAGSLNYGQNLSQLSSPSSVAIDSSGNVYIADSGNHRIVQWLVGAQQGRIIAGTGIAGSSNTQLNYPVQIKFDIHYNLYVVDQANNRIQRFDLLYNGC